MGSTYRECWFAHIAKGLEGTVEPCEGVYAELHSGDVIAFDVDIVRWEEGEERTEWAQWVVYVRNTDPRLLHSIAQAINPFKEREEAAV